MISFSGMCWKMRNEKAKWNDEAGSAGEVGPVVDVELDVRMSAHVLTSQSDHLTVRDFFRILLDQANEAV
jgi:hypothetical protein